MIFQKRTYRLFPIALLFIQYTLFFPTILSQYFENNAIRYNFETARTSNFGKALV